MKRSFIREILESINEDTISFAGGLPDETLFPTEALAQIAPSVFNDPRKWQYAQGSGLLELRAWIAARYSRMGFATTAEEILITTGSQQAMYLIARANFERAITIERPSYLGAINAFKLNRMPIEAIALESDGVTCNAFEQSLKKTQLAYIISDFQNPTTTTYSQEKRECIAKLILQHHAHLIEDAPYSELYFERPNQPISQLIPDHSYHLGSFSKVLAPSLRLGWIRASHDKIKRLLPIKESIDLHSSTLSQYVVYEYLKMQADNYEIRLTQLRQAYKQKSEIFCDLIDNHLHDFHYKRPQGGMFVYGQLEGVDTKALLQRALKHNVAFVPGAEFYPNEVLTTEMRLNFTRATPKQMEQGLKTLSTLL
jgi:2-aminoadipate transaminase